LSSGFQHTNPSGNGLSGSHRLSTGNKDALNQFDQEKILIIIKRSLPFVLLITSICILIAYLITRYTKDVYESNSVIQLDIKSEASVFGFKSFDEEINNLSKEIEFIRSKLFFHKVVDVIGLKVSYYAMGDLLNEERYNSAPFEVDYQLKNDRFYDKRIQVEILGPEKFLLRYELGKGNEIEREYVFGQKIDTEHFTFIISLTDHYHRETDNRYYYFTINSERALVNYLSNNISVQPLDFKAKTISVSFQDHNRSKAQDMVQAIDTLYLHYSLLEKNRANLQKIRFLNEQLEVTEDKLSDLETYFEDFTITNKTTDLDANLSGTIKTLNELDSQTFLLKQQIGILTNLEDKVGNNEEMLLSPTEIATLPGNSRSDIQEYEKLLLEVEKLKNSYKPNTFALQKKQQELDFIKKRVLRYIREHLAVQEERLTEIRNKRRNLEQEFTQLPSKRTEYTKTERYYNLYEEFYLSLMKNKAQFELAQAGITTDYKILSPASLPGKPVSPNVLLYFGIGAIGGIFLSFMFIGIRYLTHNKLSTQEELEALTSIPVVGSIPYFRKERSSESRLIIDKHPKSVLSEAFRSIRTNMEFLHREAEKPVICITSTVSGEGKTFVAVNLGGIISLLENKVIIIDLDMRKPRLQKVFYDNITTKGLSTILIGKHTPEECILQTNLKNLDYISSGPIPPNPAELIMSDFFTKLLDQLKTNYDVIIIDTPPVGLVTDGVQAMKHATTPIYVMRAEFSKKNFLKTAAKLIDIHNLKNLSLILNSVKSSAGYGYGSYKHGYYEEVPERDKIKIKGFFR